MKSFQRLTLKCEVFRQCEGATVDMSHEAQKIHDVDKSFKNN